MLSLADVVRQKSRRSLLRPHRADMRRADRLVRSAQSAGRAGKVRSGEHALDAEFFCLGQGRCEGGEGRYQNGQDPGRQPCIHCRFVRLSVSFAGHEFRDGNHKRHGWIILSCAVGALVAACHGITFQGARPCQAMDPMDLSCARAARSRWALPHRSPRRPSNPITARVNVTDKLQRRCSRGSLSLARKPGFRRDPALGRSPE